MQCWNVQRGAIKKRTKSHHSSGIILDRLIFGPGTDVLVFDDFQVENIKSSVFTKQMTSQKRNFSFLFYFNYCGNHVASFTDSFVYPPDIQVYNDSECCIFTKILSQV